jgi:hypothetical protein
MHPPKGIKPKMTERKLRSGKGPSKERHTAKAVRILHQATDPNTTALQSCFMMMRTRLSEKKKFYTY